MEAYRPYVQQVAAEYGGMHISHMRDEADGLLDSVRAALSVMANGILEYEGAIADFQGDAALGFWGWLP